MQKRHSPVHTDIVLIDTHTHPYLPEFENPGLIVQKAIDAGVGHLVLPAVDLSSVEPMLSLHSLFPGNTSLAFGLHPTEVTDNYREVISEMKSLSEENKTVAVGEIGIDLYWDDSNKTAQQNAFAMQIEWALERNLPIIIHCRNALDETLEVLRHASAVPRGVMHSFGGNAEDVERIRSVGDFYFGINGIVTFKNSKLRNTLPAIGLDRILLETDAPYLAPVPMRGKLCEPAFVVHTANHIANHLNLSTAELAEVTTANAKRLFNID